MPAISNVVRLFVSSTFADFTMEREALRTEVFPAVRTLCGASGVHLHVVDLRWGITEDAQRSHDTLRICLTELDRCLELARRCSRCWGIGTDGVRRRRAFQWTSSAAYRRSRGPLTGATLPCSPSGTSVTTTPFPRSIASAHTHLRKPLISPPITGS